MVPFLAPETRLTFFLLADLSTTLLSPDEVISPKSGGRLGSISGISDSKLRFSGKEVRFDRKTGGSCGGNGSTGVTDPWKAHKFHLVFKCFGKPQREKSRLAKRENDTGLKFRFA